MFQLGSNVMDAFVSEKLTEWQLPGLIERFKGKQINQICIYFMDILCYFGSF